MIGGFVVLSDFSYKIIYRSLCYSLF